MGFVERRRNERCHARRLVFRGRAFAPALAMTHTGEQLGADLGTHGAGQKGGLVRIRSLTAIGRRITLNGLVFAVLGAWLPSAAFGQALGPLGEVMPASLLERMDEAGHKGLAHTPAFANANPLMAVNDAPPAASGTPLILYIGAEYCPYCAALRWPLAIALMRFGELSGVRYSRSSSNDVYPDTVTLSFHGATFDSKLVRFESVELSDRVGKPMEKPSDAQRETFSRLNARGSIPFLALGGQYVSVGSPFSPQVLNGLDWQGVVERLEQGSNAASQSIFSEANLLTAAICVLTEQQPSDVCTAPGIQDVAKSLPH